MPIRALSFDFDGCLFHEGYVRKSCSKDVVLDNLDFLNKIKTENAPFDSVVAFIGSNRQSWQTDQENMLWKGSCFPAIKAISDALNARLDPFLLADIYGNLAAGDSYARAMDESWDEDSHSRWIFDDSKLTILYAQIQKIAHENSTDTIVFEFYDDRGRRNPDDDPDLLERLTKFFAEHREMIPGNVTLRLNHYAGETVKPISEIHGTGMIDVNFRETVKEMAKKCRSEGKCRIDAVGAIEAIEAASHDHTVKVERMHISSRERDFRAKLDRIETELRSKATKLGSKGKTDERHRYITAANCVYQLVTALDGDIHSFFSGQLSKQEFRQICEQALQEARPTLEGHVSEEQIAINVSLAFAGLGIFYAAAGLIHKAVTGRFLFFGTKLTESIDELDKVCRTACADSPKRV